jgi:predicted nucleotide-binding protein (sugar kinase/HSP70/actin superfamily)
MSATTDWIKHNLPEINPGQIKMLETYIRTHQLDLVDQFRDHIEGAYEAVEMAMNEAYYQITQADKKDKDNE